MARPRAKDAARADRAHTPLDPREYADLLDLAHDAIIVWDAAHGVILFWNKGAEALYGWTKEEAVGRAMQALLQTRFPQPFDTIVADLMRTGSWSGELTHTTRDGRHIVVESRWAQRQDTDGQLRTFMEINKDITERKRTEDALRRAEERFWGLLESAPDAIVASGADGRIVLVNSQTEALFGYRREELLGQPVELLLPAQLREGHTHHRAGYYADPRTRSMGSGLELYALTKDQRKVPVEISLSPLTIDGELLVSAAIRDVSVRLEAERERLRAEAAERAVQERDEFLSVAAHELKTPLTSLRGFTQLLLDVREAPTPRVLQTNRLALTHIERQTEKMCLLVDQLLDVARLEAGSLLLDRQDIEVTAIVAEVINAARMQTRSHDLTMEAPTSVYAWLDPLRLEQVLTNLVGNAIKYSPDGGEITITVDQPPAHDEVRLAVRDHGIGIPVAQRAHIFDRFHQAHAGSFRSGLGLGLYISHQIVALHGGRLEARFPIDGGTLFVVHLPNQRTTSAESEPRESSESARSRVLVIDDDAGIRDLAEIVLENAGYDVLMATDGASALELLRATMVNVILLDMRMPVMDGWMFARAYRQQPGPHAAIIVCTAARDVTSSAAQVQADDYLAKPFDVAELRACVARYMRSGKEWAN